MTKLSPLQQQQLERICAALTGMGCRFGIMTPDGTHMGTDAFVPKKTPGKKAPPKYPVGSLRNHIRPYLQNIQTGQVGYVPVAPYDFETIQASICSYLRETWGQNTYTTSIDRKQGHVEVLRTDGI